MAQITWKNFRNLVPDELRVSLQADGGEALQDDTAISAARVEALIPNLSSADAQRKAQRVLGLLKRTEENTPPIVPVLSQLELRLAQKESDPLAKAVASKTVNLDGLSVEVSPETAKKMKAFLENQTKHYDQPVDASVRFAERLQTLKAFFSETQFPPAVIERVVREEYSGLSLDGLVAAADRIVQEPHQIALAQELVRSFSDRMSVAQYEALRAAIAAIDPNESMPPGTFAWSRSLLELLTGQGPASPFVDGVLSADVFAAIMARPITSLSHNEIVTGAMFTLNFHRVLERCALTPELKAFAREHLVVSSAARRDGAAPRTPGDSAWAFERLATTYPQAMAEAVDAYASGNAKLDFDGFWEDVARNGKQLAMQRQQADDLRAKNARERSVFGDDDADAPPPTRPPSTVKLRPGNKDALSAASHASERPSGVVQPGPTVAVGRAIYPTVFDALRVIAQQTSLDIDRLWAYVTARAAARAETVDVVVAAMAKELDANAPPAFDAPDWFRRKVVSLSRASLNDDDDVTARYPIARKQGSPLSRAQADRRVAQIFGRFNIQEDEAGLPTKIDLVVAEGTLRLHALYRHSGTLTPIANALAADPELADYLQRGSSDGKRLHISVANTRSGSVSKFKLTTITGETDESGATKAGTDSIFRVSSYRLHDDGRLIAVSEV